MRRNRKWIAFGETFKRKKEKEKKNRLKACWCLVFTTFAMADNGIGVNGH